MFYEVTSKRTIMDNNGRDKEISETFVVDNCVFFADAEHKVLQEYNGENDVVAIKQSKIREFVNEKTDEEENIYLATIVSIFIDESTGTEKETKYLVGLWASDIDDANKKVKEYMKQGLDDLVLVAIKKSKFVDVLC